MQAPRDPDPVRKEGEPSEFLDALKKGALIGGLLLVLIVPLHMANKQRAPQAPAPVAVAPQAPQALPPARDPAAPPADGSVPAIPGLRLADFRGEQPTADARLVANWAAATRDHGSNAFVIVDKKDARVYVFGPDGRLRDSAPALLGSARGDDSYPGIGDKPLKDIHPYEKTTPAGRFVAEPGRNAGNEDVVWVDYDAAVSMHRIRPLVAQERRLERLASLTVDDNRISFGCINLPVSFYEDVLRPAVLKNGAVIYVLPDVKTPQQVFGAYDVTDPMQVASHQAGGTKARPKVQKVALQGQR
jgi:hypothetical protein